MARLTLAELSKASTSSAKQAEELVAKAQLLTGKGSKKKKNEERSKIAVPVSSSVEARALRREGYESTQNELETWEPIVKSEVRSDELRFGDRERGGTHLGTLSTNFRAETEFEKEIAQILNEEKSSLIGERAKTRSILFHADQKQKYHAKVKSKAFARGRKKKRKLRLQSEREAAAESDPELRKSLDDQAANRRVEERLSLRHAATSAWAKNIKKRGRAAIEATAHARRDTRLMERDLREKTNKEDTSEDSDASSSDDEQDDPTPEASGSKIENMQFMIAAREEQAREATRQVEALAKELDDENDDINETDQEEFSGSLLGLRVIAPKKNSNDEWIEAVRKANRASTKKKANATEDIDFTLIEKESQVEKSQTNEEKGNKKKRIRDMTQDDLLELAMDQGVAEEFATEKLETETPQTTEKNDKDSDFLPGWGTWTGEGISREEEEAFNKKRRIKKNISQIPKTNLPSDHSTQPNLILNPKRVKKQANLRVAQVPYPFSSKAQYERYMAQPLGREWNAEKAVQELIKPAVVVRPGVAIEPLTKSRQQKK
mmetsp:Transcript_7943/g.11085  ORF Transcript_7943/g.11085 Transcript_7943/m.11085 type:complete len:549 (+) Transcript_7943:41-1687(+)